ncbi:MAG: winged helix-turn-helix domain-containing protein, partial [Ruminiclostridium sp.]|nr:winged helix-turn-helix domain-containing protein [Ruminiclostridium sp.]
MEKIKITMFGEFSISYSEKTISEHSKRSKKLWLLLQYLVVHHTRSVTQSELIDILSGEDEGVNPTSALKTQVHRLRDILSELEHPLPVIICVNGAYSINPEIELDIDSERFEETFKAAGVCDDSNEKLRLILETVNIYSGEFLAKSAYE